MYMSADGGSKHYQPLSKIHSGPRLPQSHSVHKHISLVLSRDVQAKNEDSCFNL